MARAAVGGSLLGVRALGATGDGVYRCLTGQRAPALVRSS